MGNIPLSSPGMDSAYGRSTEQIDGVLILKKQPTTKQRRPGLSLPWQSARSSHNRNKRVKSLLMRSILARNWQKVLIRARLFPSEVHEFTVLDVPLPISSDSEEIESGRNSTKRTHDMGKCDGTGRISYCRVKVLPVHAACALRPPLVVVQALLSHAVGSAFSSDGIGRHRSKSLFGNPKINRRERPQRLSRPVLLHHEHNTSFAAVAVECLEDSGIGKAIVDKLYLLGVIARKASFQRDSKLRLLYSATEEEDYDSNEDIRYEDNREKSSKLAGHRSDFQDAPDHRENAKDVAIFLKQMEDHLAHNGRCQSVFRDVSPGSKSSNSSHHRRGSCRSIFVLDFDPSVLLPSPSAVRVTEKQNKALRPNGTNKIEDDLFSLENSIGDSDTAMTTSTQRLVRNHSRGDRKDGEESSSLEYLMDESSSDSSASSLLLEPPSSNCDDSDDSSDDSNSFLQLTVDGRLTVVDLQDDASSSGSGTVISTSRSESSGTNVSDTRSPDSRPLIGLPSSRASSDRRPANALPTFVPKDIQLNPSALLRSLPRGPYRKRGDGKNKSKGKNENERRRLLKPPPLEQGHEIYGLSRLLPLHVACLYGASAAVLKLLSQEYPEGSLIEVLGMLPVHMVSANWSLATTEPLPGNYSDHNFFADGVNSEEQQLAALVECSPGSLWANSSSHGLRPLEYTRILLCYPANASDEGILCARNYLDSQEKMQHDLRFDGQRSRKHTQGTVERPENVSEGSFSKEKNDDVYFNHLIDATSTCTTSGISSAWMANDSSSLHSSSASNSDSPKKRQISLGGLLSQSRWVDAMSLLENNPDAAKERCFSSTSDAVLGNERSFSLSSSSSLGLKEQLPIHMACQILKKGSSIPIDLVRLLISSYPEGPKQTDDDSMSGSLPLHLICDSFRRRHKMHNTVVVGSSEDHRAFVSERLQAMQLMLEAHPDATHIEDNNGRLPLHRAVLVGAPLEAIQLLVYRYPKAIALPYREGMTPFCLAKKVYAFDSPVVKLLKRAWI